MRDQVHQILNWKCADIDFNKHEISGGREYIKSETVSKRKIKIKSTRTAREM